MLPCHLPKSAARPGARAGVVNGVARSLRRHAALEQRSRLLLARASRDDDDAEPDWDKEMCAMQPACRLTGPPPTAR